MFTLKLFRNGLEVASIEFQDLDLMLPLPGRESSVPSSMLAGFAAGLAASAAEAEQPSEIH